MSTVTCPACHTPQQPQRLAEHSAATPPTCYRCGAVLPPDQRQSAAPPAPIPLGGSTRQNAQHTDLPAPAREESRTQPGYPSRSASAQVPGAQPAQHSNIPAAGSVPTLMDDLPMRAPVTVPPRVVLEKPSHPHQAPDPMSTWGEPVQKTARDWQRPDEVTERDAGRSSKLRVNKGPLGPLNERRTRNVVLGLLVASGATFAVLIASGVVLIRHPWSDTQNGASVSEIPSAPTPTATTGTTSTPVAPNKPVDGSPTLHGTVTKTGAAPTTGQNNSPPHANQTHHDTDSTPEAAVKVPLPVLLIPDLTIDNVDTLSCVVLQAAAEKRERHHGTGAQEDGLLLWSWFRLATACSDENAHQLLLQHIPTTLEPTADAWTTAATTGAWLIAGKTPQADKVLSRLLLITAKNKVPKTTHVHLAYVWTLVQQRKGMTALAENSLLRIVEQHPEITDAQLALAALQLQHSASFNSAMAQLHHLKQTAKEYGIAVTPAGKPPVIDSDLLLRIVNVLRVTQQPQRIETFLTDLPEQSEHMLHTTAPARRDNALLLLQNRALRHGDVHSAKRLAQQRTELHPDHVDGYRDLARLAVYGGEDPAPIFARARAHLLQPEALAELAYEQVRLALYRGDLMAAREAQHAFPHSDLASVDALIKLADAQIAYAQDLIPQAVAAYAAASKKQPRRLSARVGLIMTTVRSIPDRRTQLAQLVKLANQQYVAQLATMGAADRVQQSMWDDHSALYALALNTEQMGKHSAAAELFDQLLWEDATIDDAIPLLQRWLVLRARTGDRERALKDAHAAMLVIPDPEQASQLWVHVTRAAGQPQDAITAYQETVKQHPAIPRYQIGLAVAQMDVGQSEQATQTLDGLVNGTPTLADDPHVLSLLGRSLMGRDPLKARGYLERSIEHQPRADALVALAELKLQRDQWDEALAYYDKALLRDPRLYSIQLQTAKLFLKRGQMDDGLKRLQHIPPNAAVYEEAAELRGDLLRDNNTPDEAIRAYEGCLRITGDNVRVLLKIAELQIDALHQLKPAVDTLQRAAKADPHDAEVRRRLGYVLRDMGQDRAAQAQFKAYLKLAPDGPYADEIRTDLRDMGRGH